MSELNWQLSHSPSMLLEISSIERTLTTEALQPAEASTYPAAERSRPGALRRSVEVPERREEQHRERQQAKATSIFTTRFKVVP